MSQFKLYYHSDVGMPTLNGTSGSLLNILNFCLVTGSGWLKPFADTNNIGCFQQPTGSGLGLVVNDAATTAASAKEARLSGFDTLSAYNTGSNPFPTAAQGVGGVAMVVARKTATVDGTARNFVLAADSRSMYMFASTGDTAGTYLAFSFGDVYSLKTGSLDTNACIIIGRIAENSSTITNDGLDKLSALTTPAGGNFMSRVSSGIGGSITLSKHGDGVKGSTSTLLGAVPYLNGVDGGIYMSPIWVCEATTGNIRGRLRGLYQILHAISNFSDLTTYTYGSKSYLLLKQSGGSGVYLLETSNTLETN